MFNKIEKALIEVLQDNLKTVPKDNILAKEPKQDMKFPAVYISNVDFEINETGVGRTIRSKDNELYDTFSGDGETKEFTLKVKPLRPITAVEYPQGKKLNKDDYQINYEKGIIIFQSSPEKGEKNILVRYPKPAKMKGLKLNLKYNFNIFAVDERERDAISVEILETILREEDSLTQKGISIKPIGGFNVPSDGDISPETYSKTIEYLIEYDLQVEIPFPRMEKIELQRI